MSALRKRNSNPNSAKLTPKISHESVRDKFEFKRMSDAHLNNETNSTNQYKGLDPKYYNDAETYKPNLDFSVQIDLRKEFIRHKRVICSMREFYKFDIQPKWDLSYCQNFMDDEPKNQNEDLITNISVRD